MRRHVLPLLSIVLGSGLSYGADSRPLSTLKEKGLARSGRTFVVEADEAVAGKIKGARPIFAAHAALTSRRDAAEQSARELSQLDERRSELQQKLADMNQRINEQGFQQMSNSGRPGGGFPQGNNFPQGNGFPQPTNLSQMISQRDMIQSELAEIASEQKSHRADPAKPLDRKALDKEIETSLEACKAAIADLRKQADEVAKQYEALNSDAKVKSALAEFEKTNKGSFKLGPSDAFKSAVKTLDQAEKKILNKKAVVATTKKKSRSRR